MKRIKAKNSAGIKRRAFTLLELLLACAIITIAAGACAFSLWKTYKEKAQSEVVAKIQKACTLAQTIARISHSEVRLLFLEEQGVWQMQYAFRFRASQGLNRYAKSKTKLDGVRTIRCEPASRVKDTLSLSFFPFGIDNPDKVLEVQFDDKMYPISFKKNKETAIEEYPKEVYEKEKEILYTN